jgi:hypothetical protein
VLKSFTINPDFKIKRQLLTCNMIYLTSSQKRERHLSNATTAHAAENPVWFSKIKRSIDNAIANNPGKREQVILKWVRSAERINANEVKAEILKHYDSTGKA